MEGYRGIVCEAFYAGDQVKVKGGAASKWVGKAGRILRWIHDYWYVVWVEGEELVLDASQGNMELLWRKPWWKEGGGNL